jgi:hypothetical protein
MNTTTSVLTLPPGSTFRDIPQFPHANYHVNVDWDYLPKHLEHLDTYELTVILDPEYQRGYVWTDAQRTAYLEYILRGGMSGRAIYCNCPGWMGRKSRNWGPFEVVDGKQRIDAVLKFLADEIPVFGLVRSQFEGRMPSAVNFDWYVNCLEDPVEVVQWYLGLNTGGSVHTEKDLQPAYDVLSRLTGGQK